MGTRIAAQDLANVDLHRDAKPGERRGWRAGEAAGLRVPLPEALVVGAGGREPAQAEAPALPLCRVGLEDPPVRLLAEAPGIVGRPGPSGVGRAENERGRPLGERRGEEGADGAALGTAEQRCLFRPDVVQNGTDVIEHLLVRAEREDAIGQPRAAPVEHDEARERRHALEELGVRRQPLVLLEMRHVARGEEQIERTVAQHLVGDIELAALRVPGGALHDEQCLSCRLAGCVGSRRAGRPRRSSGHLSSRGCRRRISWRSLV